MSLPIKISQLVTMSVITTDDFMPIVDSGSNSTQRVTIGTLKSFFETGSYTGSFKGTLTGTASWANNAVTSSYSITSSYAESAKNVPGLYETVVVPTGHWFKVGHVIRKTKLGESGGFNGYTTCSINGDLSGSEAIGLIVDSGSSSNSEQTIRVCYQGLADFSNDLATHTASYLVTPLQTGSVYFMSNGGSLTLTEPTDVGSITKPMLIAVTTSSGIIINNRGIKLGSNLTTSSLVLSSYQQTIGGTSGCGVIPDSLARPPAYLRGTLLCFAASGDAGFSQFDELDLTSVFSTSSALPYSSPFMSLTTFPVSSSFTASFKPTASSVPHVTDKTGSLRMVDIGKWKLKIYS